MRINNNVSALQVYTSLTNTNRAIAKSTERLASGIRINSVGDDAAGMAISKKMQRQISGLDMADRNTMDGVSLLQTADGALQSLHDMVQRMRELSLQAGTDTVGDDDREMIQMEIDQLKQEITDVTNKTEFNTIKLLNGEAQNLVLQVGPRKDMEINLHINNMDATSIGVDVLDVTTLDNAQTAIDLCDKAISFISANRADIGAYINRLEYTSQSLQNTSEATSASLSRIYDTDMAWEMTQLSKNNVLSQAGMAIMAQANARPQQILQLIG